MQQTEASQPALVSTSGSVPSSDAVRRSVVAVGLVGIALIHLLDLQSKFEEVPYLGIAYLGLIAASLLGAELVIRRGGRESYLAAAALAAAVMAGYIVNRTVGMPGATDDIGNWFEPLGLASLGVEAAVIWYALSGWFAGTKAARA